MSYIIKPAVFHWQQIIILFFFKHIVTHAITIDIYIYISIGCVREWVHRVCSMQGP